MSGNRKRGLIKVTFLGESTTGKSSIAKRLVCNDFVENIDSTIGAAFMTLRADNFRLDIWDTSGQERYLSLCTMYYRNTDIFLLVFDVNNLSTINRLKYYIDKIVQEIHYEYKIIIVGNKIDLIKDFDLYSVDNIVKNKLSSYQDLYDKIEYVYMSAKVGTNSRDLLNRLVKIGDYLNEKGTLATPANAVITLAKKDSDEISEPIRYCSC